MSNLTHLSVQLSQKDSGTSADANHEYFVYSLPHLPKLQVLTLTGLRIARESTRVFSQYAKLVSLTLSSPNPTAYKWNFEQCRKLTYLELSSYEGPVTRQAKVYLPASKSLVAQMALKHLSFNTIVNLQELHHAACVTRLELSPLCLQASRIAWPSTWSQLQQLTASLHFKSDDDNDAEFMHLPPQWASYSNLTRLSLAQYVADDVPEWITHLQQLKQFDLTFPTLHTFPTGLCYLSELRSLDLSNSQFPLSNHTVRLADLSLLTKLKLGRHAYDENGHNPDAILPVEYQTLKNLEAACLARELPLLRRYPSGLHGATFYWWDFFV